MDEARFKALDVRLARLSPEERHRIWTLTRSIGEAENLVSRLEAEAAARVPLEITPTPEWSRELRLPDEQWQASAMRAELTDRFAGNAERARRHYECLVAATCGPPKTMTNLSRTETKAMPTKTTTTTRDPHRAVLSALAAGEDIDDMLDDEDSAAAFVALANRAREAGRPVGELAREQLENERIERAQETIRKASRGRAAAERFGGDASQLGMGTVDDPELRGRAQDFGCEPRELVALGRVPDDDASDEEREAYQSKLTKIAERPRKKKAAAEQRRERIRQIEGELSRQIRSGDGAAADLAHARSLQKELAQLRLDEAAAARDEIAAAAEA